MIKRVQLVALDVRCAASFLNVSTFSLAIRSISGNYAAVFYAAGLIDSPGYPPRSATKARRDRRARVSGSCFLALRWARMGFPVTRL